MNYFSHSNPNTLFYDDFTKDIFTRILLKKQFDTLKDEKDEKSDDDKNKESDSNNSDDDKKE